MINHRSMKYRDKIQKTTFFLLAFCLILFFVFLCIYYYESNEQNLRS